MRSDGGRWEECGTAPNIAVSGRRDIYHDSIFVKTRHDLIQNKSMTLGKKILLPDFYNCVCLSVSKYLNCIL